MDTKSKSTRAEQTSAELLEEEFNGVFGRETVRNYLADSTAGHLLPLMAERFARERLRALAQAESKIAKEVPEVLFVCVHNSGRSQMAAGLLHEVAHDRVHVRTAGSQPTDTIGPEVRQAMEEAGVDLSREFPKPLTKEFVAAADFVITMGCGDACPVFPGKRYADWELEDPAGKDLQTVRRRSARRCLNCTREGRPQRGRTQ